MTLENKNVLITGGSRGIGANIVLKVAELGANIAFTYSSSEEKANKLVEEVYENFKVKIKAYKSDASSFKETIELHKKISTDFKTIDCLVNNAGITKDNLLLRMTEEDFKKVIDVNLNSVFNFTKVFMRDFLKNKSGSIINISSVVGIQGNAGQSNYAASKAAIIGFTKSIAKEVGSRNIRCNAIAPGFIETEMTTSLDEKIVAEWKKSIPLKQIGQGTDVANAVVFLCSDMSKYITGQTINVCGGLLI